jgi:hypothetical protein
MNKSRKDHKPQAESVERDQDLPDTVRPGGIVEQTLRVAAEKHQVVRPLCQTLLRDLEVVRGQLREKTQARANRGRLEPSESAELLQAAIKEHVYGSFGPDPVLLLCLVSQSGAKVSDELYEKARQPYRKSGVQYTLALGNLIPAWFPPNVEDHAYRTNANETALRDWSAFHWRLTTQSKQPLPGLATGFPTLDAMSGGLRDTTLIAGPTGAGKTTLVQNLIVGVLRHNERAGVMVVTLEQTKDEYYTKLLSRESGLDYRTLVSATRSESVNSCLAEAIVRLKKEVLPRLCVRDDLPRPEIDGMAGTLLGPINRFREAAAVDEVVLVVDSVQELPVESSLSGFAGSDEPPARSLNQLEIDEARIRLLLKVQRRTRSALRPEGFPVVGVSRVIKNAQGHRLTLDDIPGRADIVHEVASVFLLEALEQRSANPDVTPTILKVAKIRDGGQRGEIRLDFHHTVSRFQEVTRAAPREQAGSAASDVQSSHAAGAKRFAGKRTPIGGAGS